VKTVLGSLVTDNISQQEMKVLDRKSDKNTQEGTLSLSLSLFINFKHNIMFWLFNMAVNRYKINYVNGLTEIVELGAAGSLTQLLCLVQQQWVGQVLWRGIHPRHS
jgi:hypothetical protein